MICSWRFTIRVRNLIHSLCILVTEFNSSATILPIIHIQNMTPLTGQAWTERCSWTERCVEAHSEQQEVVLVHCFWICGSEISGLSMEILFVLRINLLVFLLFFSYPLASKCGITVMMHYLFTSCITCPINIVTCCLRGLT